MSSLARRALLLGSLLAAALPGTLRAGTELERAAALLKSRRPAEAQALLLDVVKADPKNAEAFSLLGRAQLALHRTAEAAESAKAAVALDPRKATYHVWLGHALGTRAMEASLFTKMSLAGDVRAEYETAVRLEPASREARFALFDYYMNAPGLVGGGDAKARDFARATQALDASRGHYMMGRVLQKQKDARAAEAEYRLAAGADPAYAAPWNELGYLELQRRNTDAALAAFRKQLELDPENPNSYDSLADGLSAAGKGDEAIAAWRSALERDPLFVSSLRSLGRALEQAGRRDEAIRHYREAARLGTERGRPEVAKQAKERLKALGAAE